MTSMQVPLSMLQMEFAITLSRHKAGCLSMPFLFRSFLGLGSAVLILRCGFLVTDSVWLLVVVRSVGGRDFGTAQFYIVLVVGMFSLFLYCGRR